ncbi:MAG: sigma-54-dependent Fis family transcriptional regulator [Halothiobacillus sp. 14-56-357]|jgi:two-component system response regulator PilR (NtrC family)|uniref:sigma-54-dependent transcriptional regulator n=2 Tax=unclassified Halothiobacillus TaxID=2636392 RepID=UPI000BCD7BEC|nr:sigma-54 dependent transcriptional regulator [Halothiobacillus sp. 15-55-196]OZB36603.1 MAG: sigma-54-dependent Fis family transcriptional regulator [Halothiobacillus sp. 15-55-196]OZB55605.1 MAG: sigma-54-dependent Fis family transcriptional regulator [Halothiobacillus sp. 14-56-357]OZB77785.1 MAG: sigma-54-dependent Fis family transcriptional regulator [Halothiobacillus sp. 13-55-115]
MTACLIVDDELDIRTLIALSLRREGVTCHLAADLASARAQLAELGHTLSFCLTDMRLPDGDGLDLLDEIRQRFPDLPVAVITAHGQVDAAVRALKAGAFDFVSKPIEQLVLKRLLRDALKARTLDSATDVATLDAEGVSATQPETAPADGQPDVGMNAAAKSPLIGQSRAMQMLRETIAKVARSQAPVFICGESGTGKELVARQIHELSGRADGPFIPVNCGAIPAELIESELFGHRKGAFTGAHQAHEGLFRAAEGGSLFLDEVADLPLGLQVKLLRAIQERKVRPVGELTEVPIDVRIISASHQDLNAAVRDGRFRHDLFYRLNVIELRVPPLRARLEDLPELCAHILGKLAEREHRRPPHLTAEALHWLAQQSFEGNVRGLENLLERAIALTEGDLLGVSALTDFPGDNSYESSAEQNGLHSGSPPDVKSTWGATPPTSALEAEEQRQVLSALETTRWNRSEAARRLGLSLRQLRYRLAKWGVE